MAFEGRDPVCIILKIFIRKNEIFGYRERWNRGEIYVFFLSYIYILYTMIWLYLSGFFHPYGEIVNIQIIPVGQKFPEECHKFIDTADFEESFCAIVEFLTARVAKFVVGVLRKRIEGLNFRIGLLKPGLAEEMVVQDSIKFYSSLFLFFSNFLLKLIRVRIYLAKFHHEKIRNEKTQE